MLQAVTQDDLDSADTKRQVVLLAKRMTTVEKAAGAPQYFITITERLLDYSCGDLSLAVFLSKLIRLREGTPMHQEIFLSVEKWNKWGLFRNTVDRCNDVLKEVGLLDFAPSVRNRPRRYNMNIERLFDSWQRFETEQKNLLAQFPDKLKSSNGVVRLLHAHATDLHAQTTGLHGYAMISNNK